MSQGGVAVLILSGLLDLPTDRICHHLAEKKVPFLRVNRDQVAALAITIDPRNATMTCRYNDEIWQVGGNLRSVWWRQPTFLRNTSTPELTPAEQLELSQWSAVMRGMMLFDEAVWMNSPASTYSAESKPYQLRRAVKLGFDVPPTVVTNDVTADIPGLVGTRIALKGVDTVLLRDSRHQYFGYTNLLDWSECADEYFHLVPAICQAPLSPKLDLRVTIVGDRVWCDAITQADRGIEGDWRTVPKSELAFHDFDLPVAIVERCQLLIRDLGLRFGAIDLALSGDRFWFIEINPTGEWGWLDREHRGISEAIAAELACPHS